MTTATIVTSKPDEWTLPRPHRDASLRRRKHGPIRPMKKPGLISRLFNSV